MDTTLKKQLEAYAFSNSQPFCYSCYKEAPTGRCKHCGSDDLMRLVPGVGCEYGIDWVIQHLVEENLESVDTEEEFEQSIRDCYPEEVTVGWMKLDAVSVMKEMDPVSWNIAKSEWESQEEQEGQLVTFDYGTTFYRLCDIEQMVS